MERTEPTWARVLLRLASIGVVAAGLLVFAAINGNIQDYWQDIILQCGIAVIMAVSLNIINGFTGQFSIGHAGFMVVGAYVGGSMSSLMWAPLRHSLMLAHPRWSTDQMLAAYQAHYWWALPAGLLFGGLAAALFGFLVGIPSLRLRGDYLAIVTLGFGEIIRVLLANSAKLSPALEFWGGPLGFQGVPRVAGVITVFGIAALTIALARNLKVSLHGLAFQAIREDEVAAEAMGVPTTRVKVAAFALGAFLAGVGGALFAHAFLVAPADFNFVRSITYVVMVVLGGTGSITGAASAAVVLTLVPEALKYFKDYIPGFKDEYRMVIYAVVLIAMMLLRPQGVFGRAELGLPRRRRGRDATALPAAADPHRPPAAGDEGGEVLKVTHCHKDFGGLVAVADLNLTLRQGEVVGLIGPNGAGKTTVFNLLTGVYEPSSGAVYFSGRLQAGERPYPAPLRLALLLADALLAAAGGWLVGHIVSSTINAAVTPLFVATALIWVAVGAGRRRRGRPGYRPHHFAEAGIARTFQNIRLFPDLSVVQNVEIASYTRRQTNLFDALFRTGRMEREDAQVEAHALDLLRRFKLDELADVPARNLPYGAQRRLEIARALATYPRLLLLDEPAAGMNPQEKAELMHDILRLRDEFGITILLIEHDMGVVMGICERIYVLDYGEVIAEGEPEAIRRDPKVIAAYLGEEVASPAEP